MELIITCIPLLNMIRDKNILKYLQQSSFLSQIALYIESIGTTTHRLKAYHKPQLILRQLTGTGTMARQDLP